MDTKSFDVLAASRFEVTGEGGRREWRTAWNKIGRGWRGRAEGTIGFELFLFPGQKYVLQLGERKQLRTPFETFDTVGGQIE